MIIFGDAVVHFPIDEIGLLFRPKLLSSVRPRDFAAACFFLDRVGTKFAVADLPRAYIGCVCPCTVRARYRELFFVSN